MNGQCTFPVMARAVAHWKVPPMNRDDKYFLIGSIIIPLGLWWVFYGRDKYSMKGQR